MSQKPISKKWPPNLNTKKQPEIGCVFDFLLNFSRLKCPVKLYWLCV